MRKKLLLLAAALLTGLSGWADVTDVTSTYLTNPSFEYSAAGTASSAQALTSGGTYYGWSLPSLGTSYVNISIGDGTTCAGNAFGVPTAAAGSYYWFARRGWNGSSSADATLSTTTASLPAGEYSLTVSYKALDSWDSSHTSKGSYITINAVEGETTLATVKTSTFTAVNGNSAGKDKFTGDANWQTANIPFTVETAGTVNLNFVLHLVGGVRSDVVIDNLILKSGVDLTNWNEAKTAAQTALDSYDESYATTERQAVVDAMGVDDPTTTAGMNSAISTLNDAVSTYKTAAQIPTDIKAYLDYEKTNNSTADFSSIDVTSYSTVADGKAAIKTQRNTSVTESLTTGQDLTGLIDNAGFELGTTDYWTVKTSTDTGAKSTTSDTYKMTQSEGNYLFNNYWQGTPITQNIGKLPAGAYELSAIVASNGGTVYMLVNDNHDSYVETSSDASIGIAASHVFTLDAEAEVTIGIVGGGKGENVVGAHKPYQADGYWFYKVDNFQLKYLGATAPENTLDGYYTLSTASSYITRGGDSSTEAVMTATESDALPVMITTDAAGIQTLQFADTEKYMMWNGEMVYTDGTIDPAKTTHLPYWKVTAVEGGYQILNTESGKYLATTTTTRDDADITVVTCSDTPATWTLTLANAQESDYKGLNEAIETAEAKTLGFKSGEYAPYNNVAALQALAAAKAIDQTAKNAQIIVQETTAILNEKEWTANTEEVNAIQPLSAYTASSLADASNRIYAMGWDKYNGQTDAYNTRIMVAPDASNAGLTENALFTKFDTHYGDVDGYTMPLQANKLYKISFRYAGCGSNPTTTVSVKDENSTSLTLSSATFKPATSDGNSNSEHWYDYTAYFKTNDAGNYVLYLTKGVSSQAQTVLSNLELKTATDYARTTAEGKYGTVCLPYNFKATGATLSTISNIEANGTITLTDAGDDPTVGTAGVPYIYNATADAQTFAYTSGDVVSAPVIGDNGLIGSFTKTYVPANSYVMQTQGDPGVQGFYKVAADNSVYCGANKCYLTVSDGAREAYFFGEGEETAISAVNALLNGDAKIYDLNGRQLQKLQKGINIVNGKKIIVK